MRSRGMLGQYAGFFTRAAAMFVDILIVMGLIFALYWCIRIPIAFFFNIDTDTCSASDLQTMVPQIGALFMRGRDTSPEWLCSMIDFIWTITAFLATPVYFVFFYSSTGQTIGMYILGVRVVRMDGKHMSLWGALVRWICLLLAAIPFGLGLLWVIIDDRRQGWHDKLAHTCVIYAWRAEEDNLIISRIRRWLSGDPARRVLGDRNVPVMPRPAGLPKLDLLTIAFPQYDRLDDVLDLIQKGVVDGNSHCQRYRASQGRKRLGWRAGSHNLSVGSKVNDMADEPLMLPDYELKRIMTDVPAESFVVAVVLEDHYGDTLVRTISARSIGARPSLRPGRADQPDQGCRNT